MLIGNTSEPTIDFQGTFVRFSGSKVQSNFESLMFFFSKVFLIPEA